MPSSWPPLCYSVSELSCERCGGKINVYLPSHCLCSSICFCHSHQSVYRHSISKFSLSSNATFCICLPPICSFFLCPTAFHHPPSPPLLYFPHYPPLPSISPSPSLPFSLLPLLAFLAQDRSALITLMALMIQLNGALSPRCLSKAFLCSLLMQQHSAVTAASVLSLWA